MKPKMVFVLGDSRTGTTSLNGLFLELGFKAIHYYVDESGIRTPTHEFRASNWELLRDFYLNSGYNAFSDYPTRAFWREIYEAFPDAYYILSMRRSTEIWQESMRGYFSKRGEEVDVDQLTEHYLSENAEIEHFFSKAPKAKLLKVVIDDGSDNGAKVKSFLGIDSPALLGRLNASDRDKVQKRWDQSARDKLENRPRKFARHSDVVRKALNDSYSQDAHDKPSYVKAAYFSGKEIQNALELGGGVGDYAFHVMEVMKPQQLTVFDLSEYAVDAGNTRSLKQGLAIEFEQRDLETLILPSETYDLIYASNSIHHVEGLENLFRQVNRALTSEGIFFCRDYMGPDYMQWSETQLAVMNDLLATFPEAFARNSLREGVVDKTIRRIPLEKFRENDPSEGVRASEILPLMHEYLHVLELRPLGETIVYELLRGRVANFDDNDEKDAFILRLLVAIEKVLLDSGVLGSDFNLVVARKRKGGE